MRAFELADKIKQLMMDTGRGSKEIRFIDPEGHVFDITDIVLDIENNCFFMHGEAIE